MVSTDLIEKIPKAIEEATQLKFSFYNQLTWLIKPIISS
jgi:hypothetical protein